MTCTLPVSESMVPKANGPPFPEVGLNKPNDNPLSLSHA